MGPLIFWQNIPSIHQAPLLRAVARQWPAEVLVVTESDISKERLGQGWQRPDFSPARLVVSPTQEERYALCEQYGVKESVHIFTGLHAYPDTYRALKLISKSAAHIGLFVEAGRSNDGFKSILRRARYRVEAARWGKRLNFLLAAGQTGVSWYRRCGFHKEIIYPFGYFVEPYAAVEEDVFPHRVETDPFRLLFVGQICQGKGIDLLFNALQSLSQPNWQLDVVGKGPMADSYAKKTYHNHLREKVRWLGVIPNSVVREKMASVDALVLPSRYDGWGAVVNEALMAGTRVIVSDACGAADLVQDSSRGHVFKSGSVHSLQCALSDAIQTRFLHESKRRGLRSWSEHAISPDVAARYLLQVVEHSRGSHGHRRPTAPWSGKQEVH